MHPTAELVRSVLRWSLSVVLHEETSHGRFPGPRLSQFCIGNLMSRSDTETCIAIAKEIAKIEKAEETDIYMEALVQCIRSSWGAPAKGKPRRTGAEDTVMVASRMVTTVRRFGSPAQRDFIETCCSLKTWKQAESMMPGRIWTSIRDDFEKIAKLLYLKESYTVCLTAEFITQLSKR